MNLPLHSADAVARELAQGLIDGTVQFSRVHHNLAQEYIVTTEDKIRLQLLSYREGSNASSDWKAPAGILATLLATWATVDFKEFLGLSADFWRAVFAISSVLSAVWTLWTIIQAFRYRKARDIDEFIRRIKTSPPP